MIKWIKNESIRWLIGLILITLAFSATVVSTYLSSVGLVHLLDVLKIEIDYTQEFVVAFVILLQSMVFFGSIARGFIYRYCPQHYKFINKFIYVAFFISVLSTITFFSQFDATDRKEAIEGVINLIPILEGSVRKWLIESLTSFSLIYIGAVALDLMSMKFPGIGSDLIFKISTRKKIELNENSIISRIVNIVYTLIDNLLSKIEYKIDVKIVKDKNVKDIHKEEEEEEVKDKIVKDIFEEEEVKDKIVKDKKNVLKYPNEFKDKVKDKKKCPKISLTKKKYPKEVNDKKLRTEVKDKIVKDSPKVTKKSPKVVNLKFMEVARYILDEFNDGELISWDKVKEFSQITDEYTLKKLRNYLKDKDIIRTECKKSYRNNCPKDVLKKIKMS